MGQSQLIGLESIDYEPHYQKLSLDKGYKVRDIILSLRSI